MHAVRLHELGPAGNLRYERVADPRPGPGQVRIAVRVAGVHLLDTHIRAGEHRRVVAHLGQPNGGYAELALSPAEALHELPDGVADVAAVAMIVTGRTTLAILEEARSGAKTSSCRTRSAPPWPTGRRRSRSTAWAETPAAPCSSFSPPAAG